MPNDDQPRDVVLFQPFLRPVDGSTKKVGVINTLMLKNWLSRRHKDVLEVTRKDALDIVNVSDAVSRLAPNRAPKRRQHGSGREARTLSSLGGYNNRSAIAPEGGSDPPAPCVCQG